jgi:hypothetical protein
MNIVHNRAWAGITRHLVALTALSLMALSCYLFTAAGCAQNAAGPTIRSADLKTIGIWIFMLGTCPAVGWVVTRPGGSAWRRAAQGMLFNIFGWMLMIVLGTTISSSFDPSSRTCTEYIGVSQSPIL